MNYRAIIACAGLTACLVFTGQALAQQKPNEGKEQFYRPVGSSDLVTILPPRINQDRTLQSNDIDFFTGEGGCPDEINIASIDEDSIFGNVDIQVVIENDIVIQCR